jgi:hypothetical protein
LFERLQGQGRLRCTDFPQAWDLFDMGEVVHHPAKMSVGELEQTTDACKRRMYAWPVLLRKAFKTGWHTRDVTSAMFAWQSNANYRNVSFGKSP